MNRALQWVVAVVLLGGCPAEQKAAPAPVAEKAAAVADAAAAVVDAGPAAAPAAPAEPEPPPPVEVKFRGTVDLGKLKPARIVFVVAKGPCAEGASELEVLEQSDVSPGTLFTETSFPPGTVANLCAVALDAKGRMNGFAAYAKNPVTFEGQAFVEVKDVVLKLKAVKPRPAPKGL
jgi:hypothetical protein